MEFEQINELLTTGFSCGRSTNIKTTVSCKLDSIRR